MNRVIDPRISHLVLFETKSMDSKGKQGQPTAFHRSRPERKIVTLLQELGVPTATILMNGDAADSDQVDKQLTRGLPLIVLSDTGGLADHFAKCFQDAKDKQRKVFAKKAEARKRFSKGGKHSPDTADANTTLSEWSEPQVETTFDSEFTNPLSPDDSQSGDILKGGSSAKSASTLEQAATSFQGSTKKNQKKEKTIYYLEIGPDGGDDVCGVPSMKKLIDDKMPVGERFDHVKSLRVRKLATLGAHTLLFSPQPFHPSFADSSSFYIRMGTRQMKLPKGALLSSDWSSTSIGTGRPGSKQSIPAKRFTMIKTKRRNSTPKRKMTQRNGGAICAGATSAFASLVCVLCCAVC